jgi:holo-[acyl-carrier protein] synthase
MIFGIGVDIVDTGRFERFVREDNQPLLERLFTPVEFAYCAPKKQCATHYASRFAAKEAFLKALGTGLRDGLSWHDIEVVNDRLGKPSLRFTGKAAELYGAHNLKACHLSLSHDGSAAVAMVVLEA